MPRNSARDRFTLETLQSVRYSRGDAETTIAEYTYTYNGGSVTKYARIEDLTRAERDSVLKFILLYGAAQTITRRGKPRGIAVAARIPGYKPKPRRPTAPPVDSIADLELEPVTLEQLETDTDSAPDKDE